MVSQNLHVVVGLGVTGLSCVRFLMKRHIQVAVTDTRQNPPGLEKLLQEFPEIHFSVGGLDKDLLENAAQIVVSPGVALTEPAIASFAGKETPIIGDIELFAQNVKAPIIAITGTNAKSTVTTLVGKMAEAAGLRVAVGGNLGMPALDLLDGPTPDVFVLELSSFQLDTTYSLAPRVATVLNVTPDHMDRYNTLEDYAASKQRVYRHATSVVCNREDRLTECQQPVKHKFYFTLNEPGKNEFGLRMQNNIVYLAHESNLLLPVNELPILGRHYQANALAAIAIGYSYGLPMAPLLKTLIEFKGLPHRCQLITERLGVRWYNDSKGTNVGATLAAIEGLGPEISGKIILIAGGIGKNADFSPLVPPIENYVKTVILIGEAAPILAKTIGDRVALRFAETMEEAINIAEAQAIAGDSVLLSPACASFDMFNNFEHRGEVFAKIVEGL